jgi:hypothetical protein
MRQIITISLAFLAVLALVHVAAGQGIPSTAGTILLMPSFRFCHLWAFLRRHLVRWRCSYGSLQPCAVRNFTYTGFVARDELDFGVEFNPIFGPENLKLMFYDPLGGDERYALIAAL